MKCEQCNKEFNSDETDNVYCYQCWDDITENQARMIMDLIKRYESCKSQLSISESKVKIALEGLELIASGRAVANDMSSFGKKFEDLQICARTTIKNIGEVGNA